MRKGSKAHVFSLRGKERKGRRRNDALNAGHPAVIIAQLKKARRVLEAGRAELALRGLDGGLGLRRGVHVLREDRTRQVAPQSPALVWLVLLLGRDPLGRDVVAALLHVEQRALRARLNMQKINK